MSHGIFGWDLPPGVHLSDIPGNRPEDEEWERIYDNFFDKERLTKTTKGTRLTEEQYALMNDMYGGKDSGLIDSYIIAAIEYGMEIGEKNAILVHQENEYYGKEERLRLAKEVTEELRELLKESK